MTRTLGFFDLALALKLLALWSRRGGSSAVRWWVRPGRIDELGQPYWHNEIVALLLVPYFAQLALVAGPLALPGIHSAMTATGVIAEVVVGLAVTVPFGYRTALPVHIYPQWLKAERARALEWIRADWQARPNR